MGRDSGGGGGGNGGGSRTGGKASAAGPGTPKTVGSWINVGSGKNRVGVIFNAKETIAGDDFYSFGARDRKIGWSGLVRAKDGEIFNSRYDVLHKQPSVHGTTYRLIQDAVKL